MSEPPYIYSVSDTSRSELEKRIIHAQEKHGDMDSDALCWGALDLECQEVREAIQQRDKEQLYYELYDVACVAIRRAQTLIVEIQEEKENAAQE